MSKSKFVSAAIIAIVSTIAVNQAHAEEPLVAGSGRIYYYLASHPDRDSYTGKETTATKLGSNGGTQAILAYSRRESGLDGNRSAATGSKLDAFASVGPVIKQRRAAH